MRPTASASLLVLTCAVSPRVAPRLVRADRSLRQADYQKSANRWASILSGSGVEVLIIENTGSDISFMSDEFVSQGVAWHSLCYDEDLTIQAMGKGNAEAHMLDRIATWLGSADARYRMVYKVTGRLVVRNFSQIHSCCVRSEADMVARVRYDRTQFDTRFFAAKTDFWINYLTGMGDEIDELHEKYLEHALALRMAKAIYDGRSWAPFERYPSIQGVSGSTGARYGGRRDRLLGELATLVARVYRAGYL